MTRAIQLLSTAILASLGAFAQPPTTYDLRPVITPIMNIGGEDIAKCTLPDPALVNDNGDIALLAFCKRDTIFAPPRLVVTTGDVVDGKFIRMLPWSALVAFNNRGQVLYKAFFADSAEAPLETWSQGLFLDRRFLSLVKFGNYDREYNYSLTDDGRVLAQVPNSDPASDVQTQITQKNPVPCPVDAARFANARDYANQGDLFGNNSGFARCGFPSYLSVISTNRHGQFLLPLNFRENGFMILLATPVAR